MTIINSGSYVHYGYCVLKDADADKIYGTSEGKGPAEGIDLVGVVTYEGGTVAYREATAMNAAVSAQTGRRSATRKRAIDCLELVDVRDDLGNQRGVFETRR